MPPRPLDMPDPHRHPRQLRRIGIDLDPQHRLRPHLRKLPLQAQRLGLHARLVFQVLQRLQRQIEKIARPTGRVQHAEPPQPFQEPVIQRLRRRLSAARPPPAARRRRQRRLDLRLRLRPFRLQRPADHRIDQHLDLRPVGVMRAQLAALVGIEAALEQACRGSTDRSPPNRASPRGSAGRYRRVSSGSAVASSNSPPLNQGTSTNPTSPPLVAIAPNNWLAYSAERAGRRFASASICVEQARPAAGPRRRRTCRTPGG